jgi:FkbM family methyltransferase
MKKIKIEVGSNTGIDTLNLSLDGSIVYAFEPTHELISQFLWPLSITNPNIKIIPFAVDVENDFKTFNIAGQSDWGCSSLFNFTENIAEQWPNRPDFKFTHSYQVPTIKLKDFVILYNINEIEYLHVDAQGNDLNVLKSLEDKISIVKSGVVEASNKINLYKDVNNNIQEIRNYLINNGFRITHEQINDEFDAEVNIFFKRKLLTN